MKRPNEQNDPRRRVRVAREVHTKRFRIWIYFGWIHLGSPEIFGGNSPPAGRALLHFLFSLHFYLLFFSSSIIVKSVLRLPSLMGQQLPYGFNSHQGSPWHEIIAYASVIDRSRDVVLGLVKNGIRKCSGESLGGIPTKVEVFRLDPPNSPGMRSKRTKRDPRIPSRTAKASLGNSNSRTS